MAQPLKHPQSESDGFHSRYIPADGRQPALTACVDPMRNHRAACSSGFYKHRTATARENRFDVLMCTFFCGTVKVERRKPRPRTPSTDVNKLYSSAFLPGLQLQLKMAISVWCYCYGTRY